VLIRRPAVIAFAVGLTVITTGTVGLLLARHWTPAMRPVAAGVAALPAPGPSSGAIRSAESKKRRPSTTGACSRIS
jgi:hypothetical protein